MLNRAYLQKVTSMKIKPASSPFFFLAIYNSLAIFFMMTILITKIKSHQYPIESHFTTLRNYLHAV